MRSATWRLILGLSALALAAGCSRPEDRRAAAPPPPATSAPAVAAASNLPRPPPLVDRAGLIAAADAAADAFAAGGTYPAAARELAGRRFLARLPFGCVPAVAPDGGAAVFDPKAKTLQLSVRPEVWSAEPWARDLLDAADAEAIEGFWVRRPWLKTPVCPAGPPARPLDVVSPEVLGLAEVYAKGGSRAVRHGDRGLEVKTRVDDAAGLAGGLRLVIRGRIADPPDHRPIRCGAPNADRRPTCLVRVEVDRVAFETAAGEVLAQWGD